MVHGSFEDIQSEFSPMLVIHVVLGVLVVPSCLNPCLRLNCQYHPAEADGEASYIKQTGEAEGQKIEAIGMANAEAYKAQVEALGQTQTAIVNAIKSLAEKNIKIMPDILVTGSAGGSTEGLVATVLGLLTKKEQKGRS